MKSLEELKALRDKMKNVVELREDDSGSGSVRVVVGMATCGIAAGARPVLTAFSDLVQEKGLKNTTVIQTGCIGLCQYEPIVEVLEPAGKTTYVKVTPEMAGEIVESHLVNGRPVAKYTIESAKN